jgi:hypothetical protein
MNGGCRRRPIPLPVSPGGAEDEQAKARSERQLLRLDLVPGSVTQILKKTTEAGRELNMAGHGRGRAGPQKYCVDSQYYFNDLSVPLQYSFEI